MPREALEPGAFPAKDKVKPIKGADGIWRLTDVRHRTMSGSYVRTSAQGRTSKECFDQFERRWEVNRRKGTVRRRRLADRSAKFTLTDKMSKLFAHYDALQMAKAEAGKLKWYSYDQYHRSIYPCDGAGASSEAIKLDIELGGYSIGEVGRSAELHSYISDIAELSPSMAYRHHVILRVCFKIATLQGLFDVSPMHDVPAPDRTPAKPRRALNEDERYGLVHMLSRTEEWVPGHRYMLALGLTLLGTGLRPGEALALRWEDVDSLEDECAIVYVGATMIYRPGFGITRQESRKTGVHSQYWITVPQWLTRELRAWRRICAPGNESDHLFAMDDGRPVCANHTDHSLSRLRAGTDMEWFTWGNLRDTVATEVLKRSGDKTRAAAQLGHARGVSGATRLYIDPNAFVRQAVDNVEYLQHLYPRDENDSIPTILDRVHRLADA